MTLNQILKSIKENDSILRDEHKVQALHIFGSYARGEDGAKSDIDFLVEFSSPEITLFDLIRLKLFLERLLKRKVDLVTPDTLSKALKVEVLKDAIRAA